MFPFEFGWLMILCDLILKEFNQFCQFALSVKACVSFCDVMPIVHNKRNVLSYRKVERTRDCFGLQSTLDTNWLGTWAEQQQMKILSLLTLLCHHHDVIRLLFTKPFPWDGSWLVNGNTRTGRRGTWFYSALVRWLNGSQNQFIFLFH